MRASPGPPSIWIRSASSSDVSLIGSFRRTLQRYSVPPTAESAQAAQELRQPEGLGGRLPAGATIASRPGEPDDLARPLPINVTVRSVALPGRSGRGSISTAARGARRLSSTLPTHRLTRPDHTPRITPPLSHPTNKTLQSISANNVDHCQRIHQESQTSPRMCNFGKNLLFFLLFRVWYGPLSGISATLGAGLNEVSRRTQLQLTFAPRRSNLKLGLRSCVHVLDSHRIHGENPATLSRDKPSQPERRKPDGRPQPEASKYCY